MRRRLAALFVVLISSLAFAQKSDDAEKQKIIDLEEKLAAASSAQGPEMSAAFQKYLYDGQIAFIDPFGRLFRAQRSTLVEQTSKPDPNDPDTKSVYKNSGYQVDFYGDTAVVGYASTVIDSGHKNPAMNGEYSLSCLDTFVKSKGQWYGVASACVPAAPLPKERWDFVMKAMPHQ